VGTQHKEQRLTRSSGRQRQCGGDGWMARTQRIRRSQTGHVVLHVVGGEVRTKGQNQLIDLMWRRCGGRGEA
jgi:hypothetical protein